MEAGIDNCLRNDISGHKKNRPALAAIAGTLRVTRPTSMMVNTGTLK